MNDVVTPAVPPAKGHTVYTTIVEGDNDLVGLVAYSLYKRDKLAFVVKHHEDRNCAPSSDEMLAFCRGATLPGPVSNYRTKASSLLSDMYNQLLEEQVTAMQAQYKDDLITELKKAHPFWEGVWQHVVSGVVVAALLGLAAIIYYGQHAGFKQMLSNIFDLPGAESKKPEH